MGFRCGSLWIPARWQSILPLTEQVRGKPQPQICRDPDNMCLVLLLRDFKIKHIQRDSQVLFLTERGHLQNKHLAEEGRNKKNAGTTWVIDTHPVYGGIQRWCWCCQDSNVPCRWCTIGKGVCGLIHKHLLSTSIVPGTGLGAKNLVSAIRELTTY